MLVVDGAVLLAWAVRTPVSSAAAALLEEDEALAAPQAALTEALEGARRLLREGHLTAENLARLPRVVAPLLTVLAADAPLLPVAAELAAEYALALPAALALALAKARKASLATPDQRLAEAARAVLRENRVRLLGAGKAA